ncbi:right-handed parallel beta-helix repeat-containing protein [Pseudonocardia acaciae]|uniref:right-handed parallel beta-helix repeat-containing protein n=1 Tax=Pseudonocardia acaciae TaxID=551276 RepID=UPI0006852376|nr:right-handed parallel beta-helix repeat-containing protein [Pseudonocardia acaciae]
MLLTGLLAGVLAVALAGCGGGTGANASGGGVPANRPAPAPQNALPPGGCALIDDPGVAQRALDTARPGDQVCLGGPGLVSANLRITRSGAPGQPIRVLSDGAEVQDLSVHADQVEVAGFTLRDGGGLSLRGAGLRAHHNNVLNARQSGITCNCTDGAVESNVVDGTDGTGIWVSGQRITVRGNAVSGSVRRKAADADGVRFFGSELRITQNSVHDISAAGYAENEAPHPDCFQTFTSDGPPSYDVLISDNRCERVDEQCLIATGRHGNPGVPADTRAITFAGNRCDVGGAQAVGLDGYPHVDVRDNTITGPNLYRGVYLSGGSTDGAVLDNVMLVDRPAYEADPASRPVQARGNRSSR